MQFCNDFSILENFTYYFLQFYFYIAYILPNKVVMIGITITNNKVLVVTTFVAYSTSPFASLTKIGNTASAGAADCTINVFTSIADNSFNGKISELNFIKISITIGENINLPISANIVSLSNFILFSPALCKTIPIYIRDSGVTIPPKYPNVELIKAGTGILKNKKIRATIKPNNGGGNSFFQLKVAPCLSLSFVSLPINIAPNAQVETVFVT